MEATALFQFGPVHIPLHSRWPDSPQFELSVGRETVICQLLRPKRIYTHLLDPADPLSNIADAMVPIAVKGDLRLNREGYQLLASSLLRHLSPAVESLRIHTRQPSLILRSLDDLTLAAIVAADGEVLHREADAFREWLDEHDTDPPLPILRKDDWAILIHAAAQPTEPLLHEVLLLDAEMEVHSNRRAAVLFAAVACEVFLQGWIEDRADVDHKLKKWNESGLHFLKDNADIGVFLSTGRGMKEEAPQLWARLAELVRARNEVAHRGRFPARPEHVIQTARDVIDWVEALP